MHKLVRLRPAAVEIIQGCVYNKYFELLNSNNINETLYRDVVRCSRVEKLLRKMFLLLFSAAILSPEHLNQITFSHYDIRLVLFILLALYFNEYAQINLCVLTANRKGFILSVFAGIYI